MMAVAPLHNSSRCQETYLLNHDGSLVEHLLQHEEGMSTATALLRRFPMFGSKNFTLAIFDVSDVRSWFLVLKQHTC